VSHRSIPCWIVQFFVGYFYKIQQNNFPPPVDSGNAFLQRISTGLLKAISGNYFTPCNIFFSHRFGFEQWLFPTLPFCRCGISFSPTKVPHLNSNPCQAALTMILRIYGIVNVFCQRTEQFRRWASSFCVSYPIEGWTGGHACGSLQH
jgi:hypothetical protein